MKLTDSIDLPFLFIDPVLQVNGDPCKQNFLEPELEEIEKFNFYTKK